MTEKSGIYRILNKSNNKCYIGSAKNLIERKSNHFYELRSNKHHSIHLQRAYNRSLNKDVFVFEILEYCEITELYNKENYYLNIYCKSQDYIDGINKDFLKISYNILPFAQKGFYGRHRPESIKKFVENNLNRLEIVHYNSFGEYIDTYTSIGETSRKLNISKSSIAKKCKDKSFICKKVDALVSYKKDEEILLEFINKSEKPIVFRPFNYKLKYTDKMKRNIPWCTKINVEIIKTKEILKFYSQKEACVYFKLQPCTVNLCLKSGKPYKKKLLFKYDDIVQS